MKSEKMSLLAKDCARDKDDFYFICDELNMIIKLNIKNNNISIINSIPDGEAVERSIMGGIYVFNRELYIAPYKTKKIWIYNLDARKWIGIERKKLPNMAFDGMLQVFEYENFIYMVGTTYPAIIVINPINKEIEYIEEPFKAKGNPELMIDAYFRAQHVILDDFLYLPCCLDNTVLKMNLKTREYQWITVGRKENRYSGIIYDGRHFWLSPRFNTNVVEWDGEEFIREIKLPPNYPLEINYFCGIIDSDESVLLCNMLNKKSLRIQKESGEKSIEECQFTFVKQINGMVIQQEIDGKISMYKNNTKVFDYILKIKRQVAREYFKSKKMTMYNGTGIYREGNVYSLNEFIEAFFEQ